MNNQIIRADRRSEAGFTVVQLAIAMAIIGILSGIAIIGVRSARAKMQRIGSARVFAGYLEKARVDSVRRHADTTPVDTRARVILTSANTYQVMMDFDGNGSIFNADGSLESRTFTLDPEVVFSPTSYPDTITYNWRGQTGSDNSVTFLN